MKPFRVTPLTFLCLALFLSMAGKTATWGHEIKIVVPNGLENMEGDATGDPSFSGRGFRFQVAYSGAEFSSLPDSHRIITAIALRPDASITEPRTVDWGNTEWLLSTSTRSVDDMSDVFSENHGDNKTLVFDGPLVFTTDGAGPAEGPRAFDYRFELQTPFFYDPSEGSLVVDSLVPSGYSPASREDEQTLGGRQLLVAIPPGPSANLEFRQELIMEFTFVPEPSTFVLLAFGLVGLLGVALLRRR